VTVLRQAGARLEPIGAVGGLGAGEQVQAVRFLGDKGFVVTFRNTDPLFALDLSDPTAPKLRGTLQLPGYSAYLHPIGDTLLLGVGRNGAHVQASLFDVSDLAAPRRLSQLDLGAGSTPVEQDPHAFLYWPATGLAVLPLETTGFTGAVGLHTAAPLSEVGRVDHQGAPVDRALVIGDRLYTVSYRGLAASRLDTLAPLGFTAFRS
jgi:uncharacterized secreted protein with C-terminal beta-propeller domain